MPSPRLKHDLSLLPRGNSSASSQAVLSSVYPQAVLQRPDKHSLTQAAKAVMGTREGEASGSIDPQVVEPGIFVSQPEEPVSPATPDGAGSTIFTVPLGKKISPKTRHDGEKLLIQLLEKYLGIIFQGAQPGYGKCDDLILFAGGKDRDGRSSTLAIPVSVLLLSHEQAREICQQKIKTSEQAFRRNGHRQ